MADQFALLENPCIGGIDQRTDPRKVQPVKLLSGVNVQIDKSGSYGKRFGTESRGAFLSHAGYRIAPYGDQLISAGATDIGILPESAQYAWKSQDEVSPVTDIEALPVAADAGGTQGGDVAYYASGATEVLVYCWLADLSGGYGTAGHVYVKIVDALDGAIIMAPTKLTSSANAFGPRVIVSDTRAVVVWHDGGSNIVGRVASLDTASPSFATAVNIVTDASTTLDGIFDIDAGTSNTFVLVYEKAAGTNRCVVARVNTANLTVAASVALTDAVNTRIAISVDVDSSTHAWVAYSRINGGNEECLAARVNYSSATELAAPAVIFTITPTSSPGTHYVGITSITAAQYAALAWYTNATFTTGGTFGELHAAEVNTTPAAVGSSARTTYNLVLQSRPFVQDGRAYALCGLQVTDSAGVTTTTQGSEIVVDLGASDTTTSNYRARPVGLCAVRTSPRNLAPNSGAPARQSGSISHSVQDADGRWHMVGMEVQDVAASNLVAQVDYAVTFDQSERVFAELGGLSYVSGGVVQWFDGERCAEASFIHFPETLALTAQNVGGGLTPSTAYGYTAVFAYRDRLGNLHRSAPAPEVSATLGGGGAEDAFDVAGLSYCTITTRQDAANGYPPIYAELYRTKGGGDVFYRVEAEPLPASYVNVTSAEHFATIQDIDTDATIGVNEILYTQGAPTLGQLDRVCPPSASILCVHRDRLFLAGCPQRKQIWPSLKYMPGLAPAWNEALVFTLDEGGAVTGLASMDGRLIIFKADRIFYLDGDGPDNLGLNNDWRSAVRINGTVGCVDARSIVVTPIGIAFQSRSGLSLLTRGLEVQQNWGDRIQDELATYPVVAAAVLHPTLTEVRFSVHNAAADAGEELRYDYVSDAWFTASYKNGSGSAIFARGACVLSGEYHFADGNGEVWREDTSTYLDNGNQYVERSLEFAPVSAAGTLGYQDIAEVQALCERHTAHDFKVEVSADGESYSTIKTFANADLAALSPSEYPLSAKPRRTAKSRAVRVRLSDPYTSGTLGNGRGCTIAALAFKVAQKEGPYKLMGSTQKG